MGRTAAVTRKELWTLLDALEVDETWRVKGGLPQGSSTHHIAYQYNHSARKTRRGEVIMKQVDGDFLFLRIR